MTKLHVVAQMRLGGGAGRGWMGQVRVRKGSGKQDKTGKLQYEGSGLWSSNWLGSRYGSLGLVV